MLLTYCFLRGWLGGYNPKMILPRLTYTYICLLLRVSHSYALWITQSIMYLQALNNSTNNRASKYEVSPSNPHLP